MRRGLFAVLVVSLLVTRAGTADARSALAQEEIDPDDVLLSISVDERGHSEWTVEYRTRLDTNESERAFQEYRADLGSDPGSHEERFYNRMNATVADASDVTGREMALRNVSVTASRETLPQEYGVVTLTVEWTNLAAVGGDRLTVTEPFANGFEPERTFTVEAPDGYEVTSETPEPSSSGDATASWEAGTSLEGFELVLEPSDGGETDGGTGDGDTDGDGAGLGASVGVAALAGGALVERRRT